MENKRKKPVVLIILFAALLLAAAVGAGCVLIRTNRLKHTNDQANDLRARGEYAQALNAYSRLMENDPLSFLPVDRAYVQAGADGVLFCADALLESSDGARYLAENNVLEQVLSSATHPAVPGSFRTDATMRIQRNEAILADLAAEQKALQEQAEKLAAEAQRRQALLEEALRAWDDGRLEEAQELVKQSGLQPELIDEIEAQIIREHDEAVAAQAQAVLANLELQKALTLAEQLIDPSAREALRQEIENSWSQLEPQLREKYGNSLFAGAWYSICLGDTPRLTGDKRYAGLESTLALGDTVIGGVFSWMKLSDGKVELIGDTLGAAKTAAQISDAKDGALGLNHGLILHANGAVTHLGARQYGRGDAESWTGIVKVAAGAFHSLGLTQDGTVVAAGLDLDGQCQVGEWADVVAIAAGLRHSVALTRDGRVLAAGDDSFGQCDVSDWENVVDVRCGGNFTLGLTADGRLLAAGDNGCGQCDVAGWEHVIAFDGGLWHTLALTRDGNVLAAGANGHDQCALYGTQLFATDHESALPAAFAEKEGEFVYEGDAKDGPWLYCGGEGSVIVAFDADTGKIKATRADLICTYGHPPIGILSGGGDQPSTAVKASVLARQNQAVFALTGDYFSFDYNPDGLQIRRGILIREKQQEVGFGFYPDGSMRIIDPHTVTAQDLLDMGVNDSWVFGPALIENGVALDISRNKLSHNDVTMRSVMGSICPYHHIGAAYGFSTLTQVVDNLLGYGCEIAYNLDGGRSSMLLFMGNPVNKTAFINKGWRGLKDMVGFITSDLVPAPYGK